MRYFSASTMTHNGKARPPAMMTRRRIGAKLSAAPVLGLVVFLVGLSPSSAAGECEHWGYEEVNGPSHWPGCFAGCAGSAQSPINLKSAEREVSIDGLELVNYDKEDGATYTLRNTGHSVQVDLSSTSFREISGGGLPATYRLAQFHFHWGSANNKGSEHTVDGVQYPLEMHCVHYDKQYSGVDDASGHPQGLAVVAVLFEIGAKNEYFDKIVDKLTSITIGGASQAITTFALTRLLPGSRGEYYRYNGSLTTPECNEGVIWTVFRDRVTITNTQIGAFRSSLFVDEYENVTVVDNYRPVQPLGGRSVYLSPAARIQHGGILLLVLVVCSAWHAT